MKKLSPQLYGVLVVILVAVIGFFVGRLTAPHHGGHHHGGHHHKTVKEAARGKQSSLPRSSGTTANSPTYPIANPADVPPQVSQTLAKIDAGQWPPQDGSGTKGGTPWHNREGKLPQTTPDGKPVHYTEWDVNEKEPGHNRDAQRIITGDDGSAYYTLDHYNTFTRIR